MKAKESVPLFVMIVSALLLTSCLLPGMIPLNGEPTVPVEAAETPAAAEPVATTASNASMPTMEKNAEVLLEKLKAGEVVYLQQLAEENYTQADLDKPGTLTYSVNLTEDKPAYVSYGWCTTTEEILQQNFEHIKLGFFFNGEALGSDVIHPLSLTRPDGFVCWDFGVLMSDWPPGEHKLITVATFDQKINDGAADFEAGDYVHEYHVTVK